MSKQRNTPERAHMLMMRRIEQNFRVGTPHPLGESPLGPGYVQPSASVPGGRRRKDKRGL